MGSRLVLQHKDLIVTRSTVGGMDVLLVTTRGWTDVTLAQRGRRDGLAYPTSFNRKMVQRLNLKEADIEEALNVAEVINRIEGGK